MMYCPSCAGHVNAFTGEITTVAPRTDAVSTIIAVYVACSRCALVSQLDGQQSLIDLGFVSCSDLEEPIVPGDNFPLLALDMGPVLRALES